MLLHSDVRVLAFLDWYWLVAEWTDGHPLVSKRCLIFLWASVSFESPVILTKDLFAVGASERKKVQL